MNRAVGLALAAGLLAWPDVSAGRFDDAMAPFAIAFEGEVSSYRDMSVFVMPTSKLTIDVVGGSPGEYTIRTDEGLLARREPRKWQWQAPAAPGVYTLHVDAPSDRDAMTLRAVVLVPATRMKNGYLNGYRIGAYPDKPPNDNPIYRPPRGFIEVTKKNQDTKLSPHFRLKQFICKQEPIEGFPKYVAIEERLILALEAILQQLNERGFDADTLHVMSGYRTPHYNRLLRDATYSMHQFGRAADVFVDEKHKGVMDDLTRDGRVDLKDARYLYDLVEQLIAPPPFRKFEGGLGLYPATSAHPPFVHVDVRGHRARWKG